VQKSPSVLSPAPQNVITAKADLDSEKKLFLEHIDYSEINFLKELKDKTFGEKVKYLRKLNGWGFIEFARYADIGQATLARIESGQIRGISIASTIAKLAFAFDVEESILLGKGYEKPGLSMESSGVSFFWKLLLKKTYSDNGTAAPEDKKELVNKIKRLANLTKREEEVIDLIYLKGKKAKEIKNILKISKARIHKLRKVALKKLRAAAKIVKAEDESDTKLKPVAISAKVPKIKSKLDQSLRDVVNPQELTQNTIEGILSALFSNKKLTLAFSRKLKGLESVQLRALVRQLKEWKDSTAQKNSKMKALLDNFTILEYDDLKSELDERGIDVNAKDGLIFNYAPKPMNESEDVANLGIAIRPVYIIEQEGRFPENYYYPLLEMVTVSIAKELLHWDEGQLREALAVSKIDMETFGIDTAIDEKFGILIFRILPKMERYENDSRIDRYTRLMQFLRSA
jgi:transcriptional regulator with XRE-family HTH domain